MTSAVFFDLDGTLVDSDSARDAAVRAMVDWDDVVDLWRDLEEKYFDAYLAGEISHAEQRRRRVADLHAALKRPVRENWFGDYLKAYEDAWRAFPDAAPTLAALKTRVGVLTNGRHDQQQAKLVASGLRSAVEALVTSDELGVAKPSGAAFAAACDAFGLPPKEVVYVGDRLDVDAHAACAAGLRGIWLNRAGAEAATTVETIRSLHELPALI